MDRFVADLGAFTPTFGPILLAFAIIAALVWSVTIITARVVAKRLLITQAEHLKSLVHVLSQKDVCDMPRTNPELFLISRADEIKAAETLAAASEALRKALEELKTAKESLLK
jgi:hypothetical protein